MRGLFYQAQAGEGLGSVVYLPVHPKGLWGTGCLGTGDEGLVLEPAARVVARSRKLVEELLVRFGMAELVEQLLGRANRAEIRVFRQMRPHAAQRVDALEHVRPKQQLFTPRRRLLDVEGREYAALLQLAAEVQLHIAGSFEFLVDHVVHFAAGIHQTGGDDRQAATFFDVARRAKDALWRVNGRRIESAGQGATAGWHNQIVGARQARDAVEQHDDMALDFDQPLGTVERHFGDAHVVLHRVVERRGDDLRVHRAIHIRDFFRTLADQRDH